MNGASYVTQSEFDSHQGQVARELAETRAVARGAVDQVQAVRSAVLEGMADLRKDIAQRLDKLHDELDELKERSSVTELRRLQSEKAQLRQELSKRDARGEKRIDWALTLVASLTTTAVGSLITWFLAHH